MALSDAGNEARSLSKLKVSLGNSGPNNIKIFEDNRRCEKWTCTLPEPNQTKHVDVAYHRNREWVKLGKLSILPVSTDLQLVDAMTIKAAAATVA